MSEEYVEMLRNVGASDETIEFADRLVARYSQRDLDREWHAGLLVGFGLACTILGSIYLAVAM